MINRNPQGQLWPGAMLCGTPRFDLTLTLMFDHDLEGTAGHGSGKNWRWNFSNRSGSIIEDVMRYAGFGICLTSPGRTV